MNPQSLGHEPSALTTRPVFLKPGVATHLCVAKILQSVAKKSIVLIKSDYYNFFLTKPYKFVYCYHLVNVVNLLVYFCPKVITLTAITVDQFRVFVRRTFLCVANKNLS